MSTTHEGFTPEWLHHYLADCADRDSRHPYDSQATMEATARGRAAFIWKRLYAENQGVRPSGR